MIEKMDKILAKTMEVSTEVDCLVYAKNIDELLDYLKKDNVEINGVFPFINAVSIKAKSGKIKRLLSHKSTKFISTQTKVFAMMHLARKILGIDGSLTGKGITVVYVDTGIHPHLDFTLGGERIVRFIDLINSRVFPYDDNGHGTFVSGVGSGNGRTSGGKYAGISPNSNIISIKALNETGEASAVKILEAMQWIYENHKKYNIKVVCMSFGSEPLGENDPIMKGAEELWKKGLTVVAAAGNSGPEYKSIKSPGISKNIITVGGFDDNRINGEDFNPKFFEIAEFSSRGPAFNQFKPDFVAPAVDIVSCGIDEPYTTLSGTSVATPMIAGLSALLYEKEPKLTPSQVKSIIKQLSSPITFNQNKEGFGFPCFKKV